MQPMNIDSPNGRSLEISCDFRENDLLRDLPSKRFNAKKRVWVAPALRRNVEFLMARCGGASWSPKARELCKAAMASVQIPGTEPLPRGFEFKTIPFDKQRECVTRFHNHEVSAWFMGTGTGKSKCAIDLTAIKYIKGDINAGVFFCPATVKLPWMKTQFTAHCSVPYECYVHDGDDKKFEEFLNRRVDGMKYMLVSTEALSVGPCKKLVAMIKRFMMAHRCFALVDEGHDIKNHKSIRTEHAIELSKYCTHKTIMTGTPIDEGLMDLYPYFEFLNPQILGFGDFYSFRARYAMMGGYEDKQIVSYQNVEELLDLIKPHVFQCSKNEMADMPEKLYQRRYLKMTPEQKKLYKELTREHVIEDGEILHEVENSLELMMLQQYIASGYYSYNKVVPDMLGDDGEELMEREVKVIHESPPKIKECMKWIEEDIPKSDSVIIWSRWKLEREAMAAHLEARYGAGSVLVMRGGMSPTKKDELRERFEAREARFFLAHPASGGVGLTLNAANWVAYLSNTFRYLHREQSEDRCHRIGQSRNVTYMDFVMQGTVDEHVLEAIALKHNVATWVDTTLRETKVRNRAKAAIADLSGL